MSRQPDSERDVIVQHVHGDAGDRWVIFLGQDKRAEMDNAQHALVFARLLADLKQCPVWMCHDEGRGEMKRIDPRSLRGCSCC